MGMDEVLSELRLLFYGKQIEHPADLAEEVSSLLVPVLADAEKWRKVKFLGNRTDSDECDKDCPYFTTEIVDGCKIFAGCPFCQVVDALEGEVKV